MAAGAGEVQALMKGSLETDVLLHAVMQKEAKLRTGRLISHCAMVSVPTYARRFVISDVALNIAPEPTRSVTSARTRSASRARSALSCRGGGAGRGGDGAHEDASLPRRAILAKMADRRQIVGGIVDGPLDLDAAVDAAAARTKHISSPVAGAADVLVVRISKPAT